MATAMISSAVRSWSSELIHSMNLTGSRSEYSVMGRPSGRNGFGPLPRLCGSEAPPGGSVSGASVAVTGWNWRDASRIAERLVARRHRC